ncbi:hypothetical protein MKW94_028176 [Papaver nudicaule]|uniref:Uncharacterized protein n=2 Tax=Papaver nudicaule TaxID=74823 RepID=A0AA41SFC5_PAPNU|nr:hypothetical protein [Papaver nudicaule]
MELPEIAEFARNFSVMVRVQGPDPKGLKMRKHAFHQYQSGKTTLSASGFLLPNSFNKFPIVKHIRENSSSVSALVVTVASVVEPFLSEQHRDSNTQVDVPISSCSLLALVEAPPSPTEQGSWEVGWSLASLNNDHQAFKDPPRLQVRSRLFTCTVALMACLAHLSFFSCYLSCILATASVAEK